MISDLLASHIRKRLKYIHIAGIATMLIFFFLLFYLGRDTGVHTLAAEMILLLMGILMAMSYATLLPRPQAEPAAPLALFFILNACTSLLVWATGIIQSPFIIFYVILIIITSQLYSYVYGLLQCLVALAGFILVYGATTQRILSYHSLLPEATLSDLLQPGSVIFVYGALYAALFLFTILSSSNARTLLFRPIKKLDFDSTYQEKIIQEMPIGVIILDNDLTILGNNPAAAVQFPADIPSHLEDYLQETDSELKKLITRLSKDGETITTTWRMDTGNKIRVRLSAHALKSEKKTGTTYIIFLEAL